MAVKEITREELKAKLDRGEEVFLVETLGPRYYEDAHLPGAINIPHTEVDEQAPRMLPDKSAQVVVYCSSGACKNSPPRRRDASTRWGTRTSTTTGRASRAG